VGHGPAAAQDLPEPLTVREIDARRRPSFLGRGRIGGNDAAGRVHDGDGRELGVAGAGLGDERCHLATVEMALVLEMPSQHLDGLSVRREEAIVL